MENTLKNNGLTIARKACTGLRTGHLLSDMEELLKD